MPVWAVPITSLPSRAGGIARSWIGVKVSELSCRQFLLQAQKKGQFCKCGHSLFLSFWRGAVVTHYTDTRQEPSAAHIQFLDFALK